MSTKNQQLQIRVTEAEKVALQAQATAAGLDLSAYVLERALRPRAQQFQRLLDAMVGGDHRYALAELNDLLTSCPPTEFADMAADATLSGLDSYLQNYVAAMVEQAAFPLSVPPPDWTARITPLSAPHFVTPLVSLRLHLLRASPVPFKRRNIFVDSALGARV